MTYIMEVYLYTSLNQDTSDFEIARAEFLKPFIYVSVLKNLDFYDKSNCLVEKMNGNYLVGSTRGFSEIVGLTNTKDKIECLSIEGVIDRSDYKEGYIKGYEHDSRIHPIPFYGWHLTDAKMQMLQKKFKVLGCCDYNGDIFKLMSKYNFDVTRYGH